MAASATCESPLDERARENEWTDELIGRLMVEAPRRADDVELAKTLGLPPYCRGAMRAARSRLWAIER